MLNNRMHTVLKIAAIIIVAVIIIPVQHGGGVY
jgi:hypothetical protein